MIYKNFKVVFIVYKVLFSQEGNMRNAEKMPESKFAGLKEELGLFRKIMIIQLIKSNILL